MRVAIFGGTFDPVHTAHLTAAREAANIFGLDKVLFVPAANPPHKIESTSASYQDRYEMVRLVCREDPRFEASRLEEGCGKSYSILTIERVKARLSPADTLFFLIGADAFADLESWKRWEDVVQSVEFLVVTRPGHRYEAPPGARFHSLETLALPVSSSEIRQQLAAGLPPEDLPPVVLDYILRQGLYRS